MRITREDAADRLGRLRSRLISIPLIGTWLERLVAVSFVDRAIALGALAFSSLFPMLIVYGAIVPLVDAKDFANSIVERLDLSGSAAQAVRAALAPPEAVAQSTTVIGVLLALVSVLSFARGLQRLYEQCFDLPAAGVRGTPWHVLWVALIPIYLSVRPLVAGIASGWWHIAGSMLLGVVAWLATPYIILARRLPWQRLMPSAIITAAAMIVLSGASLIYMPHSLGASAKQFGAIGVAFALLSWLMLAGFVLVGSAAAGAAVQREIERRHERAGD